MRKVLRGYANHIHGEPCYLFNSGAGYRITPTQQIDLHIGIGLNDRAPAYIVGTRRGPRPSAPGRCRW